MKLLNAILVIGYRDFLKFLRDRTRIMATFIFPFVFIAILGGSLQSNLGESAGYNFMIYTLTGIIGQTLFSSTVLGIISLIEDRENDFSQEMFVSPVSRYAIIFGKILGESGVAMTQALGIFAFGLIIGLPITISHILSMFPFALIVCLLGGGFGVIVMSQLSSQKSANQIFPFIMFPQFFLAGVFSPIKNLPWYLLVLSRMAPMTYAVDLLRGIYYAGAPEYSKIVINSVFTNLVVIIGMFTIFLVLGTVLFVRNEKNR